MSENIRPVQETLDLEVGMIQDSLHTPKADNNISLPLLNFAYRQYGERLSL